MKKISIVIPCYNEEGNVDLIVQKVREHIPEGYEHEFILVDDGSTDGTLDRIRENAAHFPGEVKFISFSRNFGHQFALIAGLEHADADAVIMMDADLQHPPSLIREMIARWQEGYEIVYAVRKGGRDLSIFKRTTSALFYKVINFLSNIELEAGAADFRLLDRRVVEVFKNNLSESSLFLRGLINWVGFAKHAIPFEQEVRHSGKTKYSLRKMTNFAIDGITSFSIKPLRIAILLGFLLALFSFGYGVYAILMRLLTNATVGGWTSTILSVLFIGGVIILILGIIGEYIGKIYAEVKRRPRYIVRETNFGEPDRQPASPHF